MPRNLYELNLPGWTVRDTEWRSDSIRVTATFRGPTTCGFCDQTGDLPPMVNPYVQKYFDVPFCGRHVRIIVLRDRVKCSCGKYPMQSLPDLDDDHRMTRRCLTLIEDEMMSCSFEHLSRRLGPSVRTLRGVFDKVADRLETGRRIRASRIIGIDEKTIEGQRRAVIVDMSSEPSRILDILPDQTLPTLKDWWSRLPGADRVQIVVMDGYGLYEAFIKAVAPEAVIVLDRFHLGRLIVRSYKSKAVTKAKNDWEKIWNLRTKAEADIAWTKWEDRLTKVTLPFFEAFLATLHARRDDVLAYWDHRVTSAPTERHCGNIQDIMAASRGGSFEMVRTRALHRDVRPNRDLFKCPHCSGFFKERDVRITELVAEDEEILMSFACLDCRPYPEADGVKNPPIWSSGVSCGPGSAPETDACGVP